MKKCSYCGKEYSDDVAFCAVDLTPLDKPTRKAKPETEQNKFSPPTTAFECTTCSTNLRITLPEVESAIRCPKCKAKFILRKTSASPLVFLILPTPDETQTVYSNSPNQAKRSIPIHVKQALLVLELDESATIEDVRTAYRIFVKSYHPDKVANLGSELRQLAEKKTKDFNAAYKILNDFFSSPT